MASHPVGHSASVEQASPIGRLRPHHTRSPQAASTPVERLFSLRYALIRSPQLHRQTPIKRHTVIDRRSERHERVSTSPSLCVETRRSVSMQLSAYPVQERRRDCVTLYGRRRLVACQRPSCRHGAPLLRSSPTHECVRRPAPHHQRFRVFVISPSRPSTRVSTPRCVVPHQRANLPWLVGPPPRWISCAPMQRG